MIQFPKNQLCKTSTRKPWFSEAVHHVHLTTYFNMAEFNNYSDFVEALVKESLSDKTSLWVFLGYDKATSISSNFKPFKNGSSVSLIKTKDKTVFMSTGVGNCASIIGAVSGLFSNTVREFQLEFITDGKPMTIDDIERALDRLLPGTKVPITPYVQDLINKDCMFEVSVFNFNRKFINIIDFINGHINTSEDS